jgi:hypothetical protein
LRDVNPVWCSPLLQPVVTKKFMKGVRVNYNRSGILVDSVQISIFAHLPLAA